MSDLTDLLADVATARTDIMAALFGDAYQIKRITRATNSRGQPVDTLAVVDSGACRLLTMPPGVERLSGATVTVGVVNYQVQLPPNTTLKNTDTLVVNGVTFRVVAVHQPAGLTFFPLADLQLWDEDN